jgi:hypothetical protein
MRLNCIAAIFARAMDRSNIQTDEAKFGERASTARVFPAICCETRAGMIHSHAT